MRQTIKMSGSREGQGSLAPHGKSQVAKDPFSSREVHTTLCEIRRCGVMDKPIAL